MTALQALVVFGLAYLLLRPKNGTDGPDGASTPTTPVETVPIGLGEDYELTDHFRWSEFYPPLDKIPPLQVWKNYHTIARILELVRSEVDDRPIIITPHGGWHPRDLGPEQGWPSRKLTSRHRSPSVRGPGRASGQAVDFWVKGLSGPAAYDALKSVIAAGDAPTGWKRLYNADGGPGVAFVHYDNRTSGSNGAED